jgi:glycosyltransferase involved in cell wall biosynthesis
MTLVSIITPTYGREAFLKACHRNVSWQTHKDAEWLILDDSPHPSAYLMPLSGKDGITYIHSRERISIGAKRDALIERAKGNVIVSFDDDDYYGPDYVRTLLAAMRERDADMVNLRGWFVHDLRNGFFGYWNLMLKTGLHHVLSPEGVSTVTLDASNNFGLASTHLGWGGTSAFKRAVWEIHKFGDVNHNEDGLFGRRAAQTHKFVGIEDTARQFLHLIHRDNTSHCLAQYSLPSFLVPVLFPDLQ